ncbi:MAG: hypothetical protein JO002_07255 [Burkholderiaceae bacterium]|nr:hypothetical protein [Burkholderiaceae bacterium]
MLSAAWSLQIRRLGQRGTGAISWEDYGFFMGMPGLLELAMSTREKLAKLPLPWWHVWRLAEALGQMPTRPVIFE